MPGNDMPVVFKNIKFNGKMELWRREILRFKIN